MNRRAAALLLVLAALVAGIAIWWSGTERSPAEVAATEPSPRAAANEPIVALEGSAPSDAARREVATAPLPKPSTAPEAAADPAPEPATRMFLRVVDAADGSAVARARIERSQDEQPDGLTDARGLCALDFSGRAAQRISTERDGPLPRGFCRVHADGFGLAEFQEREGHEREDLALELRLQRAAVVAVALVGRSVPGAGAYSVVASTEAGNLLANEAALSLDYDFAVLHFRAECDAGGSVRLGGLPARVPLQLAVHQGAQALHSVAEPLLLEPGEERELEIDLGGACFVRGRVVDANAAPVPDVEVWLVRAGQYPKFQFTAYDENDRTALARSDASGCFDLGKVPPGSYTIGPFLDGRPRRSGEPASEIAAINAVVEVAAGESAKDVEVRVQRGLFVRGTVVGPDGLVLQRRGVQVSARSRAGHQATGITGAGGSFALGPLVAGRYELTGEGSGELTRSLPVEAPAGATDVVIALRAGALLAGRVVERAGGPGVAAVLVQSYPEDPAGVTSTRKTDETGGFECRALVPGRIALVATASGGRIAVLPPFVLAPGAEVRDVELLLAPAATLRIRGAGGAKLWWASVFQDGALVARGTLANDGTVTVSVPPGELTVRGRLVGATTDVEQVIRLAAGDDREVVLGP